MFGGDHLPRDWVARADDGAVILPPFEQSARLTLHTLGVGRDDGTKYNFFSEPQGSFKIGQKL